METYVEARTPSALPVVDGLIRLQKWLSEAIILAMALLITAEVVSRSAGDASLLIVEELASYFLVALVFLGMGIALRDRALFRVEFLVHWLPPRARNALELAFNLASLAVTLTLVWYLTGFVIDSYQRDLHAATTLGTPLWIPQLVMPLGTATLVLVLLAQSIDNAINLVRRPT